MFYAQFVLSKKGPLAKIWLAAHWEKKLTKAQVFETNIDKAVESILEPKIKMALRTTGHLLLGVVRIYSRKAKYLLADCNEAFVKIKMAFRPGLNVDLPQEAQEASLNAITLPEVFHDFDSALPELNDFDYAANQSDIGAITMTEDVPLVISNGLEDEAFGAEEDDFDAIDWANFSMSQQPVNKAGNFSDSAHEITRLPDDGHRVGSFLDQQEVSGAHLDDAPDDFADHAEMEHDDQPAMMMQDQDKTMTMIKSPDRDLPITTVDLMGWNGSAVPSGIEAEEPMEADEPDKGHGASAISLGKTTSDVTTLVQNEKEYLLLEPVEKSEKRPKRKRRLVVDELKSITGEEMKGQLNDYIDTVTTLDLAPPTRKLMLFKEMSSAEKLLNSCSLPYISKDLLNILLANMVAKHKKDEIVVTEVIEGLQLPDLTGLGAATPQPEEVTLDDQRQLAAKDSRQSLGVIAEEQPSNGPLEDQSISRTAEEDDRIILEQQHYGQLGGPPSVSPLHDEIPAELIVAQTGSPTSPPPLSPKKRPRSLNTTKDVAVNDIEAENEEEEDEEDGDNVFDDQDNYPMDASQEEKQWTSRTHQLLSSIKIKLKNKDYVNFVDLCARRDNRKMAAQKFYTLLVLKKWRSIDVGQDEPFGNIQIKAGPRMNESLEITT